MPKVAPPVVACLAVERGHPEDTVHVLRCSGAVLGFGRHDDVRAYASPRVDVSHARSVTALCRAFVARVNSSSVFVSTRV